MLFGHIVGLFTNPTEEWQKIRNESCSTGNCFINYVLLMAAIPPVCGFIGTTQVGWQVGGRDPMMLSIESAGTIATLYYLAILVGVFSMGKMIYWMISTYESEAKERDCMLLAAYTVTPIYLVGFIELYPALWLNFIIGLPALAYTVRLLYTGVPLMLGVSEERGFLLSSSILAVGMVALVSMLVITAIMWGMGFAPTIN